MAQLPSALRVPRGEAVVHVLAGALHGEVDDGRDAAPRRGAWCRSRTCRDAYVPPNGSSMWVCTSMPPGMTYLPVASIVRSAVTAARRRGRARTSAAIVSPSIEHVAGRCARSG